MTEAQWLWTAILVVNTLGGAVTAWAVLTGRPSRMQVDGDVSVRKTEKCVERGSYETHCRINRDEHARIEREFEVKVVKITDLHHALAREVSEVNRQAESTNSALVLLGQKVDHFILELRREKK